MPHAPHLITELFRLADAWGWSVEDLARELGVDRTTLVQYRSGRRAVTVRVLARIARRFREQRMVRDLVWHYLAVEYAVDAEGDSLSLVLPANVPPLAARDLRTYVDHFATAALHGKGLSIVGADASALTAALAYMERLLQHAGIPSCRLRADRMPSASETRAALAAPVLLLERFDFACEAVQTLARRRGDLIRPIALTSAQPPEELADPFLRRLLTRFTRRIDLDPPSSHGLVLAEPQAR